MANGDIASKVDELLKQKKITATAALPLMLELLKALYVSSDSQGARLETVETKVKSLEDKKEENISWMWLRDKIVQPAFMLFLGWFLFSFLPQQIKSLP